jgi:anaerobic ribonucleoside-triphosphate reductase
VQRITCHATIFRIRRITGYLVGTMDKWNDAKKAEESERVKHDELVGGN